MFAKAPWTHEFKGFFRRTFHYIPVVVVVADSPPPDWLSSPAAACFLALLGDLLLACRFSSMSPAMEAASDRTKSYALFRCAL